MITQVVWRRGERETQKENERGGGREREIEGRRLGRENVVNQSTNNIEMCNPSDALAQSKAIPKHKQVKVTHTETPVHKVC